MAQPPEYKRSTNFNDYSTSNPSSPHQGSSLDAEFNDIKTTTDTIRNNMALLQRDDGKLANLAVHAESLSNAVLTLIKATSNGYGVKGAWAADTAYAIGDLVESSQATYLCFEAHTSGLTFGANSSKFILLANAAIQTTASAVDTLSGDGSTVEFTLTNNSPSGETDVLVFVNGSLRTPTTDYTIPSNDKINFDTAPSSGTSNVIVWGTSTVVEAAKAAAQAARDTAETHRDDANEHKQTANLWANKVDGTVTDVDTGVDSSEFSSKAYANSTDSNEPTTGSSKNWATKAGSAEVQTGQGFSSKAYAQDETTGTDTTGGSSKGWSQTAKNTQVPGAGTSDRSAKHYSEVAADHKADAESAKTAAETALDSFDDRYLGSKTVSSHPSEDNDGNALLTGALYWNTGSGSITQGMYVYDGSGWDTLQTSVGGNTVTSSSGNNLNLVTPSNSNKVVINSGSNTIQLPNVRASQDNYVLAMSDKTTGETIWQVTSTAPTITSISGLLNEDSDSTLTIIGSDFNANTTVKLFSASTGGTEVASATVDTSGIPSKLVATFGASALTTAGAGQQCFVELSNSGITTRHQTGITINVDPTATFSGGSGANYSASTHLGTYGARVAGGGQDSNTKLLLNFDRWGGTDIEDSSNTGGEGHKVPTNGQTSIKASPFGDGKSAMFFDGSDDKLTIPDSDDWDIGSGNYTVEFWLYDISIADGEGFIGNQDVNGYNGWLIRRASGELNFNQWGSSSQEVNVSSSGAGIGTSKTWRHIAFVRNGNFYKLYIDGRENGSVEDLSPTTLTSSGSALQIGKHFAEGNYSNCYIDEIRIVKGTAVYTSDFTVPTSRLTAIDDTKLLIHSDKEDDASSDKRPVTATGAIQKTDQSKWGGSSWYSSGVTNVLDIPFPEIGTGDFTIDFWAYPQSPPGTDSDQVLLDTRIGSSTGWFVSWHKTNNTWRLFNFDGSSTDDHTFDSNGNGVTTAVDGWDHVAIQRSSGTIRLWVNGTQASDTDSHTNALKTGTDKTIKIFGVSGNNNAHNWKGYLDELRISSVARYSSTTSITVPTGAYTSDSNTLLLLHGDGAKFTDSTTTHTITPTGSYHSQGHGGIAPAMTWPTSKKATGSAGVYFDGSQDHLLLFDDVTTNKNDIVTAWCTGSWSLDCWLYMTAYPADSNGFTILSTTDGVTYGTDIGYYNATSGGTGYWGWIAGSAFSPQTDQTTDTPALNTWMHLLLVLSWSGTTMSMKVYKDGKYLGSQSYASGSSNTNFNDYDDLDYMTIGGNAYYSGGGGSWSAANGKNWNGYIDNYRFSTGDVTADSTDPLYTNSQTSTSSNNFVSGLPTKIYGAYTPKTIDTITFTGDTSQALAGDEDIEFSEVTNTNQPAQKQDFSDIGLSITNLTGSDKNKATLTGTLNFANNTSVPKLAMKVQVRKTLGNSAGTSGQATITFSSGTTTAGLSPNMIVTGTGINTSETKITSVDSSTQITVDNNHASTVSGDLIFLDPDRVAHMNGSDTYSTGDDALTIATGDGSPVLFNARRYMGDTVGARDINGFGFQPGLIWFKDRDGTNWHHSFDIVRGAKEGLFPNDSHAGDSGDHYLSAFNSDGVRLGKAGTGASNVVNGINHLDRGFIAWAWKAGGAPTGTFPSAIPSDGYANGTFASTSAGYSLITGAIGNTTMQQSVSQSGGFSITKYIADSSSASQFPHNLGGSPDFIIIKRLGTTKGWAVWHSGIDNGAFSSSNYLQLDRDTGKRHWEGEAEYLDIFMTPSATTQIKVGTPDMVTANASFICYAWKAVDKVSAFGTYTGSGGAYNSSTGKGGVTDVGFKPRWIMLKCVDASHPWVIFDSFREETDIKNNYIRANEPDSGADGADFAWEFKSTGFESTSANTGTWTNETDKTYIYIAFA